MADTVKIKVIIDPSQAKKGGKEVKEVLLDIKGTTEKTEQSTKRLGTGTVAAGNIMAMAYAEVAQRALQVIKQTRAMAFNVEETASKFKTVLGGSVSVANDFLREHASLLGVTITEGKEYVATATAIAKGLDMQEGAAADFGIEWTKLAGDFQSFFNVPFEQAFGAIRSGLVGEQEPLKQFGVVLREAEVQERALLTTGKQRAEELTELERVQARYNLIVEKAGVAVGDLERTQQSGANQNRKMEAAFRGIAEELASSTIPIWKSFAGIGLDVAGVLKDLLNLNLSDKYREEQTELNVLTTQLIRAKDAGQERKDLIDTLNENYGEYLGNIDLEKASSEELRGVLEDLNATYEDKIFLQVMSERQNEAMTEAVEKRLALRDQEQEIEKELIRINKEYGLGLDLTKGTLEENAEALADYLRASALYDGGDALNRQAKDLSVVNSALGGLTSRTNEYKSAQEEANAAVSAYNEVLEEMKASGSGAVESFADIALDASNAAIEQILNSFDGLNDVPIRLKPEVSAEIPKDVLIPENIDLPELDLAPKIGEESIQQINDRLQELQTSYTQASSDQARERLANEIEVVERTKRARENGITYIQQLQKDAHQQTVQQIADYAQAAGQAFALVSQFQAVATENRIQKTNQEKDAAIAAIDARLNNDKLSEAARERLLAQRAKTETEYQKKIDKLQHEQFERERKAKLLEIAINTAVAVSKVWGQTGLGGIIAQAAPIAMGLAQAAIVLKQANPYLEGGILQERLRPGLSSPGKKMISINENNRPEFIMNAASTARALPVLNRMNRDPQFAENISRQMAGPQLTAGSRERISENSIDANGLSSAITAAIREGMRGVIVDAHVAIDRVDEELAILKEYRGRIGNT